MQGHLQYKFLILLSDGQVLGLARHAPLQQVLLILLSDGDGAVVVETLRHQLQRQRVLLTSRLLGGGQRKRIK